jgi:putative transposase
MEHRVTGARLVKDALGWHIVLRIETLEPTPDRHPGPEVGIDAGVCVALALSDGDIRTHEAWLTAM